MANLFKVQPTGRINSNNLYKNNISDEVFVLATNEFFGQQSTSNTLTADTVAYTLSGQTANLLLTFALTASTASFALSGNNVNINVERQLIADGTTYTLTGNDASFQVSRTIEADSGQFVLIGNNVNLDKRITLSASTGIYNFTGNNVILTENPADLTCTLFYNGQFIVGKLKIKDSGVYKSIKGYKKVAGNYIQI